MTDEIPNNHTCQFTHKTKEIVEQIDDLNCLKWQQILLMKIILDTPGSSLHKASIWIQVTL
uniref:WD-repeat protein n=1 Tax=Rhizophora mucronata TaxID=61149 RepID=A0A2P2KS77_RHIMU